MRDTSLHERLVHVLDLCAAEQAALAQQFENLSQSDPVSDELQRYLNALLDRQVERLLDVVGDDAQGWRYASSVVLAHSYFRDYLSQARLLEREDNGMRKFSVDFGLMTTPVDGENSAYTPYALALRRHFLSIACAEARGKVLKGLTDILRELPPRSRVLALESKSSQEVQAAAQDKRLPFSIDILDSNRPSLDYLSQRLMPPEVQFVQCNPFDLLTGGRSFPLLGMSASPSTQKRSFELRSSAYDLIYVAAFYNYVSMTVSNPARGVVGLTSRLFDLVKPGGRLVIGNFLPPGGANPHSVAAQFLLEVFADWHLVYRSASQIVGFAENLPSYAYRASLLDETLAKPLAPDSVIGFLVIDRLV